MPVSATDQHHQRTTASVYNDVPFGAQFSSVGRVGATYEWAEAEDQEVKEVFDKVLQANDALLLQYVGISLLSQYQDSIKLRGVEFSGGPALDSMRLAWIAAVCKGSGTDCGPGDSYVVDVCANLDICEESRKKSLRALVAHDSGAAMTETFDTAHEMFVKAIQSRDVALFFPQSAP